MSEDTIDGQPTEQEKQQWLRLEVLRQAAIDSPEGANASDVTERAKQYVDFVSGETPVAPAKAETPAGTSRSSSGKRKGKSSSSKAASKAATSKTAQAAEDNSSEATATAPGDAGGSVDKETMRKALLALGEALNDNNAKAQEIMKQVGGAASVGSIPEEKYKAVHDAAIKAAQAADNGLGSGLDD